MAGVSRLAGSRRSGSSAFGMDDPALAMNQLLLCVFCKGRKVKENTPNHYPVCEECACWVINAIASDPEGNHWDEIIDERLRKIGLTA